MFFWRLGNQVDWSERREEVSSFIGDHQDLVSKRDEFQLVKRQGPACLAIASYSVKGMNGFESPALHCTAFLDGRFWARTWRGRCFIEIEFAGAVGISLLARKYQYVHVADAKWPAHRIVETASRPFLQRGRPSIVRSSRF